MYEARKYYANLLIHLSPLIQNTLKKVSELKLEIEMIGPSHGIVWRKDPGKIIQAYDYWSQYKSENKISIVYDTMWKSTEKMALTMGNLASEKGMEVKILKLRENHRSDVMAEILDSKCFLVGSPTIHRNLFPTVADLLCYIKGLKPQNKVVSAFGSYGWSGESVQQIIESLKEVKGLDVVEPGVRARYVPDKSETEASEKLIEQVIERAGKI